MIGPPGGLRETAWHDRTEARKISCKLSWTGWTTRGKREVITRHSGEERRGDITVVEIKGRIDSNTARPFGDKLTDLIKAGRKRVVLDLKNLVYISSAGFRALLLAGQLAEESQGALVLCSLSSEVQRLFDLGAFTDLFPIYSYARRA
jgi:anti-sigma B factor antagonist